MFRLAHLSQLTLTVSPFLSSVLSHLHSLLLYILHPIFFPRLFSSLFLLHFFSLFVFLCACLCFCIYVCPLVYFSIYTKKLFHFSLVFLSFLSTCVSESMYKSINIYAFISYCLFIFSLSIYLYFVYSVIYAAPVIPI